MFFLSSTIREFAVGFEPPVLQPQAGRDSRLVESVSLADSVHHETREWLGSRYEVKDYLGDADALIVRCRPAVTESLLSTMPSLRLVLMAGTGIDHIDLDACTHRGITVGHTPGANAQATAEHALTLLLALLKRLPQHQANLRRGEFLPFRSVGLAEAKVGVIGMGAVGTDLRGMLLALGATVVDLRLYAEELPDCDGVILCAPLTSETRGMVDGRFIARMKRGAVLVNCARAQLVEQDALLRALESGRLASAGLDVFEPPIEWERYPTLIVTPHVGGSTRQAQQAIGAMLRDQVAAFERGERIPHQLNDVDRHAPESELAADWYRMWKSLDID